MPLHLDSAFQRLYENEGPSDALQRELGVLLQQVRVTRTRSFDNEVNILEVADIPKELAEAFRDGHWGYQNEYAPTVQGFNP
jgi:hypothetical protein